MPWRKRGKKAVLKQKKPVVGERWTFKRSKRSVVQDLGSGRPGSVRKRDGALRVDDPPKTPGKNTKRGILQVSNEEIVEIDSHDSSDDVVFNIVEKGRERVRNYI